MWRGESLLGGGVRKIFEVIEWGEENVGDWWVMELRVLGEVWCCLLFEICFGEGDEKMLFILMGIVLGVVEVVLFVWLLEVVDKLLGDFLKGDLLI